MDEFDEIDTELVLVADGLEDMRKRLIVVLYKLRHVDWTSL